MYLASLKILRKQTRFSRDVSLCTVLNPPSYKIDVIALWRRPETKTL